METEHESSRSAPHPPEARQPKAGPPDRRKFLADFIRRGAAAGLGGAALTGAHASASDESAENGTAEPWADRMRAPDDGKRYGWVVDTRRCFGCHGCEVACKAENDVPLGSYIRQTIYHDFERAPGKVARVAVPMACQHCEDAPCIKACPCGAMHKGAGGTVQVDYDACSGHGACKDACPYGAIYIDPVANQAVKCHNCTHRIDVGMDPACVATCPSEALFFGDLNDPESSVSKMEKLLEDEDRRGASSKPTLETLRPEKQTQPRMRFVCDDDRPMDAWEPKLPREGQSYASGAYDVYNWSESAFPGDDEAEGESR